MNQDLCFGAAATRDEMAEFRAALLRDGFIVVRVSGPCMVPTLTDGETVFVRNASPRVGDVVLLEARGWLWVHRLVDRIAMGYGSWYVHMGDASFVPGLASGKDILGVVKVDRQRASGACGAHLWGLLLRLGAVLWCMGLAPNNGVARHVSRAVKKALLGLP